MFPNVRLLFGALFASVVALTCGFGLFAAFRVNHEPLSRLPVGTAPIQFVANERTGWGTPFDGQSHLNGSPHSETAAPAPAAAVTGRVSIEAANRSAAEAVKPIVAATPVIDMAPPRDIAQPAEVIEPVVSITSAAAPTPEAGKQISPSAPAADGSAEQIAHVPTISADANPAQHTGTIASMPAAPEQLGSMPAPTAGAAPVIAEPSSQEPAQNAAMVTSGPGVKQDSDSGDAVKAAAPAIAAAMPSGQPSVVAAPASGAGPSPDTLAAPAMAAAKPVDRIEATKDSKITRKPVARRRVAGRRRIVRRVRPNPAQDTAFKDPVFQTAPNFSGTPASRNVANSSNW